MTITNSGEERGASTQSCYNILSKISHFQQKFKGYPKRRESMTHRQEKKQTTETACERDQMSNLTEIFQSSHNKFVHRNKVNHDLKSKGRYDDNVTSNRKYQ